MQESEREGGGGRRDEGGGGGGGERALCSVRVSGNFFRTASQRADFFAGPPASRFFAIQPVLLFLIGPALTGRRAGGGEGGWEEGRWGGDGRGREGGGVKGGEFSHKNHGDFLWGEFHFVTA